MSPDEEFFQQVLQAGAEAVKLRHRALLVQRVSASDPGPAHTALLNLIIPSYFGAGFHYECVKSASQPSTEQFLHESPQNILINWVADDLPCHLPRATNHYVLQHLHRHRAAELLGSTTTCVVLDATDSLNYNLLGQVVNTLVGGGLFVVLVADEKAESLKLSTRRLESQLNVYKAKHKEFLFFDSSSLNAINLNELDANVARQIKLSSDSVPTAPVVQQIATVSYSGDSPMEHDQLLTSEQLVLIDDIEDAMKQPYMSFLVAGDRGRGKSTALGRLAGRIQASGRQVVVTASHRRQAARLLSASSSGEANNKSIRYLPADVLAESLVEISPHALLIVEEASALSATLLQKLIARFSHRVFATTLHGYEGTAQGFYSRFCRYLTDQPGVFEIRSLTVPLRWSEGCHLEQFFNEFLLTELLIDYSPEGGQIRKSIKRPSKLLDKDCPPLPCKIQKLSATDLYNSEALLKSVFRLLNQAHYQSQPSDIALLLDGQYHLWIASGQDALQAVLLVFEEGGFSADQKELLQGITHGKRRPAGNLVPQKLAAETGDETWCLKRSLRVIRIATREQYRREGVASFLLKELEAFASENSYAFLSSSFGYNPEVSDFWWANKFSPVFLGSKIEKASGANNLIVLRAIDGDSQLAIGKLSKLLALNLPFLAGRFLSSLGDEAIAKLAHQVDASTASRGTSVAALFRDVAPDDVRQLRRFVNSEISLASVYPALSRWYDIHADEENISPLTKLVVEEAPDWEQIARSSGLNGKKAVFAELKAVLHSML